MIYILFLISCSILLYAITTIENSIDKCVASIFGVPLLILIFCTVTYKTVINDVSEANRIIAKIKVMQPASIDNAILQRRTAELEQVKGLIKQAFDKYKIQATTADIFGIKLYIAPLGANSLGNLGDIERGSGEKLKNLEWLIEKQNKIADDIFALQIKLYKPEFYTLNQQLHTLKYSIFDGWVVRLFLKEDVSIVYNNDVYATGVNVK